MPEYAILGENRDHLSPTLVEALDGIEAYESPHGLLICFADAKRFVRQQQLASLCNIMDLDDYAHDDKRRQGLYLDALLRLGVDIRILGAEILRQHDMSCGVFVAPRINAVLTAILGRPPTLWGKRFAASVEEPGGLEFHLTEMWRPAVFGDSNESPAAVRLPVWAVAALRIATNTTSPTFWGWPVEVGDFGFVPRDR